MRPIITSLCSASYISCQRDTARICCCVPCRGAAVTGRPAAAVVDRYLLSAGRSAANPPHAAAAIDRRDRQTNRRRDGRTDGRTTYRFIDPALYAGSVNNVSGAADDGEPGGRDTATVGQVVRVQTALLRADARAGDGRREVHRPPGRLRQKQARPCHTVAQSSSHAYIQYA